MARPVGISLLGCGAVGSQVAAMLLAEREDLRRRTGVDLELRHVVVRDTARARQVSPGPGVMGSDLSVAWADEGTHIVVELVGGVTAAREMILSALRAGKDVVTANKALLAQHGRELFAAARSAGRCISFEAGVAGGIPLIESIRRGLVANRVEAVVGILNGTCNSILTRMEENQSSYAHALAEAQRAGLAEADPALDVEGTDSAHKLAVLASLAMREACEFDRIPVRGITQIELSDLTAAAELGYRCKLLALARRHEDGLELSVQPMFVPLSHPLAGVSGPFNAVSVYARPVGHTMYYGRGAGGPATASAVMSDIIEMALGNARRTFEQLCVLPDQTPPARYRPVGQSVSAHYLRMRLLDRPGGIGKVATVLGAAGISIATIVQHEPPSGGSATAVPVIVTTHPAKQQTVRTATESIGRLDVVAGEPVCIPVFDGLDE